MGYKEYVKNTAGASGGQMKVRVADAVGQTGVINGNDVQLFVRSGLTATWLGTPGFATRVYANGGWINLQNVANHRNSTSWVHVGTVRVTTNQTITFHIDRSGTQGFGGPDDFAVAITRANVPEAPTPLGIDQILHQSLRFRFSGNSNGGAPILEWQIGYGYNPSKVQWTTPSSGTSILSKLLPGRTVYTWARGRNIAGWGPWSVRSSATTRRGCMIKSKGIWVQAIPYVKYSGSWQAAEPYIKTGKVPGTSDGTWKLTS